MRWQQTARLAIAIFVVVFAGIVFVALRRPVKQASPAQTPRVDPKSIAELGRLTHSHFDKEGQLVYSVNAERQFTYPDGRTVLKSAELMLPERDGKSLKILGGELEVIRAPEGQSELQTARITEGAKLIASDGLEITSEQAVYDERTGMLTVPGDVQFTRGRMQGRGVGATYDKGRDVIWLLDKAQITVKPDARGEGAIDARARAAGLARREHYVRLTGSAHVVGEGRTLQADDLTVQLSEDDRLIRSMALRGNSRITGAAGGTGAESMAARDIDLAYGPDGRTLQQARLVENASVQMAAAGSARKVSASTIELALAPDGQTLTGLNANGNVVLELPAAADAPARRISAAALAASGPTGLQQATFSGGVQYRELTRAARGAAAAGERTARSQRLVVETLPGLGALRQADFRGNVRINDGETVADAQRAVHEVAQDTFDLTSSGDAGPIPTVDDGRVLVTARTINFTVSANRLRAQDDVRSSVQTGRGTPAARGGGGAGRANNAKGATTRLPQMLKHDQPVNVTSRALEYDGGAGVATYTGDAKLWQEQTQIQADVIILDDAKGNLTGRGHVRTVMFFDQADAATGSRKRAQTTATGDVLVYTDEKRLATYTSGPTAKAHMVGSDGDVTADQIQLYLKEGGGELERAVADGNVIVKEGFRTVTGRHLVYTPASETYVMTGSPVEVEEKTPKDCKVSTAATLTFKRAAEAMTMENNRVTPVKFRQCAAK